MMRAFMLLAVCLWGGAAAADTFAPSTVAIDVTQAGVGKSWSTGTGNVSVGQSKVLDIVLANTGTTPCTIVLRRYSNYSTSQLAFTTYNNPGALTGATVVNVGTRQAGAGPQSGLTFNYVVENPGLMTGSAGVTDGLLATSKEEIMIPYIIPAGKNTGLEITGLAGALAGAVVVGATFVGYCQ